MANLSKVFDDLFAISKGDVGALTRATEQFAHDITQVNRVPLPSTAPEKTPAAEPGPKSNEV